MLWLIWILFTTVLSAQNGYVTLVTNENYAQGALVLGQSLKETNTPHPKICMTFQDAISKETKRSLEAVGWTIYQFEHKAIKCPKNKLNDKILHFQDTCSKLLAWSFDQFTRLIYLDADSMVLQNIDHLFDIDAEFVAVPQPGEPQVFQSAIFVFTPSRAMMMKLFEYGYHHSIDGGDIYIINSLFAPQWKETPQAQLPYTYMITRVEQREYPKTKDGKADWSKIHVFDFAGPSEFKPWVLNQKPTSANYGDLFSSSLVLWNEYLAKAKAPKSHKDL